MATRPPGLWVPPLEHEEVRGTVGAGGDKMTGSRPVQEFFVCRAALPLGSVETLLHVLLAPCPHPHMCSSPHPRHSLPGHSVAASPSKANEDSCTEPLPPPALAPERSYSPAALSVLLTLYFVKPLTSCHEASPANPCVSTTLILRPRPRAPTGSLFHPHSHPFMLKSIIHQATSTGVSKL